MTGTVVVLDIGKTLTKLSCWSANARLLAKVARPNVPVVENGLARLDADRIAAFVVESLRSFASLGPVTNIIPVAHGAAIVGIRGNALAFQPLDYEQRVPADIAAAYDRQRDAFRHNGSPRLPDGLNLGRQLHWLEAREPAALAGVTLLPWPQYWAWWLSGTAASEVTSLGCHSDLWAPAAGDFSDLAHARGWAAKFAPMARAGDRIGTLRADLAKATGLSGDVAVHCGLHDSNAALLAVRGFAALDGRDATMVSTGTWFIAMRQPVTPFAIEDLPAGRDCLVNVDTAGTPVPSARFMGGREIEQLIGSDTPCIDAAEVQAQLLAAVDVVLDQGAMLLPGFAPGTGPFPDAKGSWRNRPSDPFQRGAAIALYAALVTDAMLDLVGTRDTLIVEGRFAGCAVFVRALASLRPDLDVLVTPGDGDVAAGALRLVCGAAPQAALSQVAPLAADLRGWRSQWRAAIAPTRRPVRAEAR